MSTFLSTLLLLSFAGFAQETRQLSPSEVKEYTAEADRLSGEIRTLSGRQVWAGVERKYGQVSKLGVPVSGEIHLIAAYAARERGDLLDVYERLSRAAVQSPSKEVVDWLWDLDHNYGRVRLNAGRKGRRIVRSADAIRPQPSPGGECCRRGLQERR